MPVSKRLRYEVLRRDNHTCRYCGGVAPNVVLTVDHVVPVALGGSDDPSNLVAACSDCNSGKTSSSPDAPLVDQVSADAIRWANAAREVAEERRANWEYRKALCEWFTERWNRWTWTDRNGEVHTEKLPSDYTTSVLQLHDAGLVDSDFDELIDVAMRCQTANDTFRYFCGCCWKRVKHVNGQVADRAQTMTVDQMVELFDEVNVLHTRWTTTDVEAEIMALREEYDAGNDECLVHDDGCTDRLCVLLGALAQSMVHKAYRHAAEGVTDGA